MPELLAARKPVIRKLLHYLPNTITMSRFVLTALYIAMLSMWMAHGSLAIPPGLILVLSLIYLSDLLDGAAARRLSAVSVLGAALDVSADFLFILSSYLVLILFRALPLWYMAFVLIDFLVFLLTSSYLKRAKRDTAPATFIFDVIGRISAAVFYLMPAAAIFAYSMPQYLLAFKLILYVSVLAGILSIMNRFALCLDIRRQKGEYMSGLDHQ